MNTEMESQFLSKKDNAFDIKNEIVKYLRYWPWFLAALVLTLGYSYISLRYTPRIYETSAKIKILDKNKGLELPTAGFVFNNSNINLENEIEILKSYEILEQLVKELKLTSNFFLEGRVQTNQIATLGFHYNQKIAADSITNSKQYTVTVTEKGFEIIVGDDESEVFIPNHDTYLVENSLPFDIKIESNSTLNKVLNNIYIIKIQPVNNLVLGLKGTLKVQPVGKFSDLLKLSITGVSKQRSERILNKLIEVFNEDGIIDRQLISKRTLDFIDERFVFLAEELDSIEVNKKDFKQDNDLIYLEADSQLSLGQRTQAEEEVFRLENQLAIVGLIESALKTNTDISLLPSNIGVENTSISTLIQNYNLSVIDRNKLISSAGENNPSVQLTTTALNGLKRNINSSLASYKSQLKLSLSQLTSRSNRFNNEFSRLPEKEKLLRAIERQQNIKESLYLLLLQKREEAAINLAITEPSVKVIDHAISGSIPISPKPRTTYLGAIVIGLLIPFGVLYLMFMLDTKLHGKRDIEAIVSEIPVVAEIPLIKDSSDNLFNNPNDRSLLAESFRILASNTNYMLPADNGVGKVIYSTSTIKGEGKTFVSLNCSLALASLNKKVLLIGADLRNPQLHTYLKIGKDSTGLTNYLHDINADWKTALIKGFQEHKNHDILLSGSLPPNPAHLLTNGRFKQLIEEAKTLYDYIVVDTAPTILVTDTLLISQLADVTLYVARANFTEKNIIQHSIELNKQKKLRNMAYVVNGVGANKSYGYNYGYDYGYGS